MPPDAASRARSADRAASLVEVEVLDPSHPEARHCMAQYFAELDRRVPGGFEPGRALPTEPDDLRPPSGLLVVARLAGGPAGCGAVLFRDRHMAEVKRMWVAPAARGLGLGRRLLADLESRAREHGARTVRLDTNAALTEAISLYRSAGYREVDPFNDEPHAHHWFAKRLG